MKEQFMEAVARSSQVGDHESMGLGGWITLVVFGLILSALFAAFSGAIITVLVFFCLAMFPSISGAPLFESIGNAWDTAPAYGLSGGGILGLGFFLISYVFPFVFKEKIFEKKISHEALKESLGFGGADEFAGDNFIIMADEEVTKAMVLWSKKFSDVPEYTILTANNIIESTVYVDDMTVSKVKSGAVGSLAGAAVGGALTGGVGAIVGAIAGKRSKSESEVRVHKISIHLTLKDATRPHAELIFRKPSSREDKGLKKGDMVFNHLVGSANHWQGVLKNIVAGSEEAQRPKT